jgi:ABC-2 type transport system permease protein
MRKFALVAGYEYWRFAMRRGFLFVVLGLPLLLTAIIGVSVIVIRMQTEEPVGVVDRAAILPAIPEDNGAFSVPLRFFGSEAEARGALEEGVLQAYFVIPEQYRQQGGVLLVHDGDAFDGIRGEIDDMLRAALLAEAELSPEIVSFLAAGELDIEYEQLGGGGGAGNELSAFLFPFVIGILLVMAVFTTAGYMLQAVVDEKENRTMEILVTSISAERLMFSKLAGLVGVGLTQIIAWGAFVVIGLLILRAYVPALGLLAPSPGLLFIAVAWFVPFYVVFAGLMAAIGVSVTEVSEGQQASGIISLFAAIPFYFMVALISAPDSPLSVALSLIPFSAPLSIIIRWPLTTIPLWQLVLSWSILVACAALSVFLAARLLHVGMLRYGQRLSWRQIGGALRGRPVETEKAT